ncbi:MAG: bifunctional adenosylcobinamide kinase/adenosylcobinamide-phosphate guanylyltransferase [Lachnospiraceae bacterium]|nr:bifunctional adenosylcobinamide kinase/adenosylcobinamide-phosphate guanylyltransferase [Lachnospiraceae bacterium]
MMYLVIGGSASGKSAYAEDLTCSLAEQKGLTEPLRKYYVATMESFGEEGAARVKKHRSMRRGKGFITIEQPRNVGELARQKRLQGSVVLVECMSNLVANEMFASENPLPPEQILECICSDIRSLTEITEHLIVVTNDVFGDGYVYDESTMKYVTLLGQLNRLLTEMAREVVEVVYSIPCVIKRGKNKCQ